MRSPAMTTQIVTVNRASVSPTGFLSGFHCRRWRIICNPMA